MILNEILNFTTYDDKHLYKSEYDLMSLFMSEEGKCVMCMHMYKYP